MFYVIENNTIAAPIYTWGSSIISTSGMLYSQCNSCGTTGEIPIGGFDMVVEGGSRYPDIIGCGAYPFFLLSSKSLDVLLQNNVTNIECYPVNIMKSTSNKLQDTQSVQYYRIEPKGDCRLNLDKMGMPELCSECNKIKTTQLMSTEIKYEIEPNTWDGSDLFRDNLYFPRIIFCSQRVKSLVKKHRLTNFRFDLI